MYTQDTHCRYTFMSHDQIAPLSLCSVCSTRSLTPSACPFNCLPALSPCARLASSCARPASHTLTLFVLSHLPLRLVHVQSVPVVCALCLTLAPASPSSLTCWCVVSLSLFPLFAVTYRPVLGGQASVPSVTVGLWNLHRD